MTFYDCKLQGIIVMYNYFKCSPSHDESTITLINPTKNNSTTNHNIPLRVQNMQFINRYKVQQW